MLFKHGAEKLLEIFYRGGEMREVKSVFIKIEYRLSVSLPISVSLNLFLQTYFRKFHTHTGIIKRLQVDIKHGDIYFYINSTEILLKALYKV